MITSQHLKIYESYEGDGDMLIRIGSDEEKKLIDYKTWALIDQLIQDLELIEKGLVSEKFKSQTIDKLKEACDNETTLNDLKSLVGKF